MNDPDFFFLNEKLMNEEDENKVFGNKFENKVLEKLTLSLGLMATIKPLI